MKQEPHVNWDAAYASLLELAQACDVPVGWACRTGAVPLLRDRPAVGAVAYPPEPIDQPAEATP